MLNTQNIDHAIENGYDLKITEYFSRGWEYFKLRPLEYVGYIAVMFMITMFVNFIPVLGFIISIIVSPALSVGVPIFTQKLSRDEPAEFSNFFDGFKKLTPLIVAYVLMLLIYFIVALPMIFVVGFSVFASLAGGDPENTLESIQALTSMGIWIFLFFLIIMYVAVSLRWVLYLVYFHGYDAVEAIKTSWKLTNKKWLLHLGFVLLGGLLIIAGAFALVVGLLVAVPLYYAADYIGYADVTGLDQEDVLDEIGKDYDTV